MLLNSGLNKLICFMNETPTPSNPTDRTVVVNNNHLSRLWTLTIASLALNGLILLLILIALICGHHHHHKKHDKHDGGKNNGCMQCQGGFHRPGFGRFGGGGMDRGGWGRPEMGRGGMDQGGWGRGGMKPGWGGGKGGPGMMNRGGMGFGGGMNKGAWGGGMKPGFGGMGGKMPDATQMTDMILAHLTQQLTLTDDQKAKIKPIIQDQLTQIQKDMTADKQAMQKQIEDGKGKIRPILTADQQKQFDAMPMPGDKQGASATNAAGDDQANP